MKLKLSNITDIASPNNQNFFFLGGEEGVGGGLDFNGFWWENDVIQMTC